MIWLTAAALIPLSSVTLFLWLRLRKVRLELESERTKGELARRKDFYEQLIDAVADPIFVKNNQHQWIYGNKAFSKILNLDLKDYIGKSDYDIFPKEMADVFWESDNQTLKNLEMVESEDIIMIGGEIRHIISKKTPVPGLESGTVILGVIRDFTERKRQEETIANFYNLIESSSDLYCFCDLQGRPSFINRHGLKMGFTTKLDHFRIFFTPGFDLESMQKKLDSNLSWEGEVTLINLENKLPIPYWLKIFYVLDENREPKSLSLVGTDIQERKETELKMFFGSKMASLGEMAGGIAHEINNPLAIISGKAEQIKKQLSTGEFDRAKVISAVEKIEDTSFRISKIIKGLRSFSRTGELDPTKKVSVKELIDETLDLCRERMKSESITLIQEVDHSLSVDCRATQIQQVLINLLNNSTDAIKGHTEAWIKIYTEHSPEALTITITDSGKGIPLELREKIMSPFFTTKEPGKGTGLGLSISRRIMESHNGQLVYNDGRPHTSFSLIFNT